MTKEKNTHQTNDVSELKNIIKYQQNIIKNYQDKLNVKELEAFLPDTLTTFSKYYFELYSLVTGAKTPLTILRGHIQMLRKKIINMDPTNAFLLSEEFNLFEKNISSLYEIISNIDSMHNQIPHGAKKITLAHFIAPLTDKFNKESDSPIKISYSCPEYVTIFADPLLLQLLLVSCIRHFYEENNEVKQINLSVFDANKSIIITCSAIQDKQNNSSAAPIAKFLNIINYLTAELHGKVEIGKNNKSLIIIELPINATE